MTRHLTLEEIHKMEQRLLPIREKIRKGCIQMHTEASRKLIRESMDKATQKVAEDIFRKSIQEEVDREMNPERVKD